ncbi:MAG TPA: hypothetical protein HA348_06780 [Thermoplasmata archaeon]|nr:hypothetical protein [Thermoplasmata archaeon]
MTIISFPWLLSIQDEDVGDVVDMVRKVWDSQKYDQGKGCVEQCLKIIMQACHP